MKDATRRFKRVSVELDFRENKATIASRKPLSPIISQIGQYWIRIAKRYEKQARVDGSKITSVLDPVRKNTITISFFSFLFRLFPTNAHTLQC